MADFGINLKDTASSTDSIIESSRGVTPLKAKETIATPSSNTTATVLKGVDSLFNTSVDALDSTIKRTVDERATEQMDQVFNEMGVDDVTLIKGTDINNEPVPSDIGKAEKNINKLTQAKNQGSLDDNSYWARVNTISRQLRARFPGHREYIDQKISRLSGGDPQTAIVKNLIEEANKNNSNAVRAAKDYSDLVERATFAGYLPADYSPQKYPDRASLLTAIAPFAAAKEAREAEKQAISLAKDRRESVGFMVTESARKTAVDMSMKLLSDQNSAIGQNYTEIVTKINDIASNRTPASPQELEALGKTFNQFKFNYTSALDNRLNEDYGQSLDAKGREEAKASGMNIINTMEQALTQKDVGTLHLLANVNELYKNGDTKRVMDVMPEFRALQAIKEIGGPQASEIMLNNSPYLKTVQARLATQRTLIDIFGDNQTLEQSVLRRKVVGDTDPAIAYASSESTVNVLTDPRTTPEMRKRAAYALFSTGNAGFVGGLSPTDKGQTRPQQSIMFNRLVNPKVHQAMKDMRDSGNTEAWDNYVSWSNNTFTSVFKQNVDNLAAISEGPQYKVYWNASKSAFEVKEGGPGKTPGGRPTNYVGVPKSIQLSVDNLNGGLRAMSSIVKDNGLTMDQFVQGLYGNLPSKVFGQKTNDQIKGGSGNDTLSTGGVDVPSPVAVQDIPQRLAEIKDQLNANHSDTQLFMQLQSENNTDPAPTDQLDKLFVERQKLMEEYSRYYETHIKQLQSKNKVQSDLMNSSLIQGLSKELNR